MVIKERSTTETNARDASFQMADLSIAAINYTRRNNEGYILEADYKGLLNSLSLKRSIHKDVILKRSQTTLELLSLFGDEELTEVPYRADHLSAIWDVSFELTSKEIFNEDGEVENFNSAIILDGIAKKRGLNREKMKEHIEGSRKFLSEFITDNRD